MFNLKYYIFMIRDWIVAHDLETNFSYVLTKETHEIESYRKLRDKIVKEGKHREEEWELGSCLIWEITMKEPDPLLLSMLIWRMYALYRYHNLPDIIAVITEDRKEKGMGHLWLIVSDEDRKKDFDTLLYAMNKDGKHFERDPEGISIRLFVEEDSDIGLLVLSLLIHTKGAK